MKRQDLSSWRGVVTRRSEMVGARFTHMIQRVPSAFGGNRIDDAGGAFPANLIPVRVHLLFFPEEIVPWQKIRSRGQILQWVTMRTSGKGV